MRRKLLIAILALSAPLWAAESALVGTVLPVSLNSSVNTRKIRAGQPIVARVMQQVPGGNIPAGARVLGRVVEVIPATKKGGARLSLQFDSLVVGKRRIPIATDLRAMASMMEVFEAQIPTNGPDRGTSEASWTTTQVGGEVVYRGGGPVANELHAVGEPVPNGVLARISAKPHTQCRGDFDDNHKLQALWVFSSDACGTYGFPDISILHAGRTPPAGQIVLISDHGEIHLHGGSGMLLRVIPGGN
jgi:hypothetical protein